MADPVTLAAILRSGQAGAPAATLGGEDQQQAAITLAALARAGLLNSGDASLGGIDYGAPRPAFAGSPSLGEAGANMPAYNRPGLRPTSGMALGPQSVQEARDLADEGRGVGTVAEMSGMAPLYRSGKAASEGRPIEAVGNAAVAMMPYKPAAGMATLGAAYGGALAQTLAPGMFEPSQANAQQPASLADPMAGDRQMLMGLTQQQATLRSQAESARQRMEAERASGEGPRFNAAKQAYEAANATANAMDARVKELQDRTSPQAVQAQGEYNRAVDAAERGLAEAKTNRVRPFKETPIGKLYEETAGWTPGIVGFGASGAMRALGHAPRKSIIEGTIAGALTPNAPLVSDMFFQPSYNPERKMFAEYARDLPATHPRRQEWTDYAKSLPEQNPARRLAVEEFYDPFKLAERFGVGALEGVAGGSLGAGVAEGARRLGSSARSGLESMLGRRSGTPEPVASSTTASGAAGAAASAQAGGRLSPEIERARRFDTEFRLAPDAPGAGQAGETWVSPAGREIVRRRGNNTWSQDGRRGSAKPPQEREGWRRISSTEGADQSGGQTMAEFLRG